MGINNEMKMGKKFWCSIYLICWKQYFIKFKMWILLFVLGILLIRLYCYVNPAEEKMQGIVVGVYAEDEKGRELLEKLKREEGIFCFQAFQREEDMVRQIENGTLECGYVFPEGFYENLLKGRRVRQVILYCSPASSAHKISYEVVFAELFEILSEDILKTYLEENYFLEGEELQEAKERVLAFNRQYAGDGSTFHFVYETINEKEEARPESLNTLRGMIGVIIYFMCLLGLANCLDQRPLCRLLPGKSGRIFYSGSIHVTIIGSILTGGICIFLSGAGGDVFNEIKGFFIYALVLEIYLRGMGFLMKKSKVLYGMLPVMLLGCCLFCPVFIKIGRYLPWAEWISFLFPVTYYLNFFMG